MYKGKNSVKEEKKERKNKERRDRETKKERERERKREAYIYRKCTLQDTTYEGRSLRH